MEEFKKKKKIFFFGFFQKLRVTLVTLDGGIREKRKRKRKKLVNKQQILYIFRSHQNNLPVD